MINISLYNGEWVSMIKINKKYFNGLPDFICFVVVLLLCSNLYAESKCGDVWHTERVGPYDYSNSFYHTSESAKESRFDSLVQMVEKIHFTPGVQSLTSFRKGSISKSIDYTLMVFPNHHIALWTAIKYEKKMGGEMPQIPHNDFNESAECYLKRAVEFKPDDMVVRKIYGSYFFMNRKFDQSLEQYKLAESTLNDDGELAYNMGLLYIKLEDYEKAKSYALKAQELKFPLTGLKKKLIKVGKWEAHQ